MGREGRPGAAAARVCEVWCDAMATLRLFAGLRQAAGTASVEISGATVGDVLREATARYGSEFEGALSRARVWLNGEEADPGDPVGPDDEVALIPPVSGGAQALRTIDPPVESLALVTAALVLIAANAFGGVAWWSAAVVAFCSVWALDVGLTVASSGRDLPMIPVLTTIIGALASVHLLGVPGLALVVVIAVVTTLGWAVASDNSRMIPIIAPALLLSLLAGSATGSLLLARTAFVPDRRAVGVFLAAVIASIAVGAAMERFRHLAFGDPFSMTALAAIVTSLVAASLWDLDLVAFLFAGIVVAAGMVAGRGLGSILRTRRVSLVDRAPGWLSAADGAVMAACLYYPILRLVA